MHPVRPAVDRCPGCDRPRCAVDAATPGAGAGGCPACRPPDAAPAARPAPARERLVRGSLAGVGASVLGGVVAAEYVDAELFAYLTPFVVGVACGAAAQAAAGARTGPVAARLRLVAAVCGVLAVGLGFLLEGSRAPLSSGAVVPSVLAVAGALLWTVPPRAGRPEGARAGRAG